MKVTLTFAICVMMAVAVSAAAPPPPPPQSAAVATKTKQTAEAMAANLFALKYREGVINGIRVIDDMHAEMHAIMDQSELSEGQRYAALAKFFADVWSSCIQQRSS